MNRLFNLAKVLTVGVLLAMLVMGVIPQRTVLAAPDTTVLSDGFESGSGNWTTSGNVSVDSTVFYAGAKSLYVGDNSSAYNKIPVQQINSPIRDAVLYWYPRSDNVTPWWDNSWLYRVRYTENWTGTSQTNFPFKIRVTNSQVFALSKADLSDWRFVDQNGTLLGASENSSYDSAAKTFTGSVSVNMTAGGWVDLYFGNAAAAATWNSSAVWSAASAVGVWHLDSTTNNGSSIYDSSGNGYTLTNNGTTWSATTGRYFDGASKYLFRETDSWRVSDTKGTIIVFMQTSNGTATETFFSSSNETDSNNSIDMRTVSGSGHEWLAYRQIANGGPANAGDSSSVSAYAINDGTWKLLTLESNGSAYSLWRSDTTNSSLSMPITVTGGSNNGGWFNTVPNRQNIVIGAIKRAAVANYLSANITEVQVYSDNKSADFISAMYQNEIGTLATVGSLTSRAGGSGVAEQVITFEEGALNTTNVPIALSWNGTSANVSLYSYMDNAITATNTSATFSPTVNTWHKLEFSSTNLSTIVLVDDVALTFGGAGSSPILTNTYNWLRFQSGSDNYLTFNVDSILIEKENIVNTTDLYGRIIDQLLDTTFLPGGMDNIYEINVYAVTGNVSFLNGAKVAANLIDVALTSGNHSLHKYLKPIALLARYDASYIGLLNAMSDDTWTYRINQTRYLAYNTVNTAGVATDNSTFVGEPPDNMTYVQAFDAGYETTGNVTYKNRAEAILNGVNIEMRHAVYGTIITGIDAVTGVDNNTASRIADEGANFIETALYHANVSGNTSWNSVAAAEANLYITQDWDGTNEVFWYRPDSHSYELYAPTMSTALSHLVIATGNTTYNDYALKNYANFLRLFLRNNQTNHIFDSVGRYAHSPTYWSQAIPSSAALLNENSANTSLFTTSDSLVDTFIRYYAPINTNGMVDGRDWTMQYSMTYPERIGYLEQILRRFVWSSGATVSWSNRDLFNGYRRVVNDPVDIQFSRTAITLDNVTGTGNITFGNGINTLVLNFAPYVGVSWNVSAHNPFPYPPTMPTVATGAVTNIGTPAGIPTATVSSTVTSMGVASSTYQGVRYGSDPASLSLSVNQTVTTTGTYPLTITNYDRTQTVYYQSFVTVGTVTSYGSVLSFTEASQTSYSLLRALLTLIIAAGIVLWCVRMGITVPSLVGIIIGLVAIALVNGIIG